MSDDGKRAGVERTGKKRQGKPEKTSNDSKKLLLTIFDFLVRRNRSWKRPTRRRYASCIYRRTIHLYSPLPPPPPTISFLSINDHPQRLSLSLSLYRSLFLSCRLLILLLLRLPSPSRDFSNYPYLPYRCFLNPVAVLTRSRRRQSRQPDSAGFNTY